MRTIALSFLVLLTTSTVCLAQRELQKSLKDIEVAEHWIYDDLPQAYAKAKATEKPILVVLRCIPCPPGRKLDVKVAQPVKTMAELQQQFVCVRIVQAKGLDLNVFQYDYDQSWTALFLNADKIIYGRYGTRDTRGPESDRYLSESSFLKAMHRALELHKNYPNNKDQLLAKIGPKVEWRYPEKIPGLEERARPVVTTRQSCIHCHMVRDRKLRAKWQQGRLKKSDLFVYPMPNRIGMKMTIADGLVVEKVTPGSFADKAGIKAGDKIVTLNKQPLLSLADIQWVLHTSPAESELAVTLTRNGKSLEKTISLKGNWKEYDISWRASTWYGLRQGLQLEDLHADGKNKTDLPKNRLAIRVKNMYGRGPQPLRNAGLRKGDVIVAVNDKSQYMTESEFLVYLRLTYGPKDRVTFTVLRNGQKRKLTVPMW